MTATFRKAFYDSRKATMWLAIGLGLYALFIMSFYSSIADQAEKFDELIQNYPEGFIAMFYDGDVADFTISDAGNYIQIEYMTWTILILGAIVIGQAFNAFTNSERDGSMDMVLSLPISRRGFLAGRVLNTTLMLAIVLTACYVVFALASVIWVEIGVTAGELFLGIYGAFFLLMVVEGFSYMLATLLPSSKRFAGTLAYLFLIGSYLIHSLSGAVDQLRDIRPLFLFDYYNAGEIIRDGVNITHWLILSGVALVYFAVAWWAVERKELGV